MMDLGTLKCLPDVSFSGFTVAIILSSTHMQFVMASRFEPFYLWSFFLSDILLFIQTLTDTAYKYISDVCSRSLYLCTAPTPRIQQQQLSEIPWLHLPWKGSWYFEPSLAIEWLKVVKRNSKFTNLCTHICISYWWLTLMCNLVYIQKCTNSHRLCLLLTLSLYERTSAVKDPQHVSRQKSMKLYSVQSKRSFRPNPPRDVALALSLPGRLDFLSRLKAIFINFKLSSNGMKYYEQCK